MGVPFTSSPRAGSSSAHARSGAGSARRSPFNPCGTAKDRDARWLHVGAAFRARTLVARATCAIALALVGAGLAGAQSPAYVTSSPLLPIIAQMPENTWLRVNTNFFSDVWTPPELIPLDDGDVDSPSHIILAWSGFAWDPNRGDLIIFGGGHANYPGNDVYRWHSRDLTWERASLPS